MLLNPESGFFKDRLLEPDSYVNLIRHTDLNQIENVIAENYTIKTEYALGVSGENIFESKKQSEAALYIITGEKESRGGKGI